MNVVFTCLLYGILLGGIYEVGKIIRGIFKNGRIITVIVDLVVFLSSGILFFIAVYKSNFGEIRFFEIAVFFFGFFIERKSIGFLLAKGAQLMYNYCCKIIRKLKGFRVFSKIFK